MVSTRSFRYYVACSLDGYIAGENGEVDWLAPYQKEDYGYARFQSAVDTILVGRRTFEQAMELTRGKGFGMRTFVLSGSPTHQLPSDATVRCDLKQLVAELRGESGKDIWVIGGGQTARSCLEVGALDRIEVHVMPIVLGSGRPLFGALRQKAPFALEESKTYENGVVYLSYRRKV